MNPYQYNKPPAWAAPPAPNGAPYWGRPGNAYGQYQQPPQPYHPPQLPQGPPIPVGYPPGGGMYYQPQQPSWATQRVRDPTPETDPTDQRSKKWPKLSAILAADTTLARFKVSGQKPSQELFASTFYTYRHLPANATPTRHMRLFSKKFPWSIEISTPEDITCETVWNHIWAIMHLPLEESEWGLLCTSGDSGQTRMKEILKAQKKRLDLNTYDDKRILRCDYLGEDAWFLGLEKDEDFQTARLMPGSDSAKRPVPEDTWLVKMGR